ncbi:hypothetical protein ACHAW5_009506 [Stephanodiscus triporus]|uniref:Uncharacterized protein n=1 Tax=Stephanodiscus triporus TaxID=2934178 RepID=A0ABD3NB12_9STRA
MCKATINPGGGGGNVHDSVGKDGHERHSPAPSQVDVHKSLGGGRAAPERRSTRRSDNNQERANGGNPLSSRSRTSSVGRSRSRSEFQERGGVSDGDGKQQRRRPSDRDINTATPKTASSSNPRSRSVSKSRTRAGSRSKSRDIKPRERRVYDTPFDEKGRCHYHRNVQLAAKKMTGGWKVVHAACPKCMEDNVEGKTGGGIIKLDGGCKGDQPAHLSLSRGSSRTGTTSRKNEGGATDAQGQHDKNGCCLVHTHIQVAKKRVFGNGFKVVRACPACNGHDVGLDDDISVSSKRSTKSTRSNASRRSSASARGKSGTATSSGRYGALPFDGDGYCCHHPSVQLAKKKALGGGFKVILDFCPECMMEDDRSCGGQRSSRKKSSIRRMSSSSSQGTERVYDDSGARLRRSGSKHHSVQK